MRIFLTGGAGFIGSHVLLNLLSRREDFEILVVDNLYNSSSTVIKNISDFTSKSFDFEQIDVRNEKKLSEIVKAFKPNLTFHFAGLKSVYESEKDPLLYYENNVVGTLNLLKAMDKNNVNKLIFSSSATVYGKPNYLPFDEKHPKNPVNYYGKTKLICEELINAWNKDSKDKGSVILRYFNPVGAHPSGKFGENPTNIPNNLFPLIIKVIKGDLKELKIYGNDYDTKDGSGIRDYIHIMDLSEAHLKSLDFLNKFYGCKIFNLGTETGFSVFEIVNMFNKISEKQITTKIMPRRKGDLASYWSKSQLAYKKLHWKPNFTINEACKHSLNWYKNTN